VSTKSCSFSSSQGFENKKKLLNAKIVSLLNSALHFNGISNLSRLSLWFYMKMLHYSFFLQGKGFKMLLCIFYAIATIWWNSCWWYCYEKSLS